MNSDQEPNNDIHVEIALLKKSTHDAVEAIHEQASQSNNLLESVNLLTLEIREDRARREAHDENREIQDNYVQEQIKSNTKRLDYFAEHYKQPIEKLITSQNRWDKFINAIFSKAGTTIFIVIIVAILYLLGINPKDIKL